MHVSAPVRVMERTEWAPVGLREFGLDPPGYTAMLYRRDVEVLGAEFGALNPQKVLQYMRLDGRDGIYLMSRFVGQEWEQALREATEPVSRVAPAGSGSASTLLAASVVGVGHGGGSTGYASITVTRTPCATP